jgi:hypothetical protein
MWTSVSPCLEPGNEPEPEPENAPKDGGGRMVPALAAAAAPHPDMPGGMFNPIPPPDIPGGIATPGPVVAAQVEIESKS